MRPAFTFQKPGGAYQGPDELRRYAKRLFKLAARLEKELGCPQDIEWAIDMDMPEGSNIALLQSRPETVWSRKKQASVSGGRPKGLAGMVSTLVKGVGTGIKKQNK